MKRIVYSRFCFFFCWFSLLVTCCGCQKHCGVSQEGIFMFLEKPVVIQDAITHYDVKIKALFFSVNYYEEHTDEISESLSEGSIPIGCDVIIGFIPTDFRNPTPVRVIISFENGYQVAFGGVYYKIKCIEKI